MRGVEDLLLQRQPPCVGVLDEHCRVLLAQRRFHALMEQRADAMCAALRHAIEAVNGTGEASLIQGDLLLHAERVEYAQTHRFVVSLQRIRTREPLYRAVQRYRLTRRETQVLDLALRGACARAIAHRLQIAEPTVREYYKHLATKIGVHSRAEMIAKVLDWRA